eukprot:672428_1
MSAKKHFAHFAQWAFPCFSALNQAKQMHMKMKMMGSPQASSASSSSSSIQLQLQIFNEKSNGWFTKQSKKWNKGLLEAFQKSAGIGHLILKEDDKQKSKHNNACDWILDVDTTASLRESSGWFKPKQVMDRGDGTTTIHSTTNTNANANANTDGANASGNDATATTTTTTATTTRYPMTNS